MLSIRLLGPVSASVQGEQVVLHGRLGRTALAALALDLGRVVDPDRLVDAFWGDDPPPTARQQVHNQVSRLRRALRESGAPDVVSTAASGYRLTVDPGVVDLASVHRLREQARAHRADGDLVRAAERLRAAREAWSGTPLGGVSTHLAAAEQGRLDELRLAVTSECLAVEVDAGRAEQVVPELAALVRAHPLSERLHRLRMLALYRSGRVADALAAFQETRETLRAELGIDPSPELRELQRQILAGSVSTRPAGPVVVTRAVPAQLPPRPRGFVGREAELARLCAVLTGPGPSGVPRLALLCGMAGVGKTALAVQAATAAAPAFPDGQLYVDLRGGTADVAERGLDPFAVLGAFLLALGVDTRAQPTDLAGRSAELRTRTARRRLLVVLDNAADEDQVEPLLVAEPGCATLVTSRSTLPGLDAPTRVAVTPMPDDAARAVLAAAAGDRGLDAEQPGAVDAIVRACAGLPLALRIAGARLATSPELSAATLGVRLASGDPLPDLTAGNKSVRASLDASTAGLSQRHRVALGRLAELDAQPFGSWVLAPLLDVSLAAADRTMRELVQVHLVEPVPGDPAGRHRFHDLVSTYARHATRHLAGQHDDSGLLRAAAWALATAPLTGTDLVAERLLPRAVVVELTRSPAGEALRDGGAAPPREFLADVARDPLGWVAGEWPVLVGLIDAARRAGRTTVAAALLLALRRPMLRLRLLDECEGVAKRLRDIDDDPWARAVAVLTLAVVDEQRGRHRAVVAKLERLAWQPGGGGGRLDGATTADVLLLLGGARRACGDVAGAEAAHRAALTRAREAGEELRQFRAHDGLAETYRTAGQQARAVRHGRWALPLADRAAGPADRARARFSLATTLVLADGAQWARRLVAEGLDLARAVGDDLGRAWCLLHGSVAARAVGDADAGVGAASDAITLARRLRAPEVELVAERELARALAADGSRTGALAAAARAMTLCLSLDNPRERRLVLDLLAELHPVGR